MRRIQILTSLLVTIFLLAACSPAANTPVSMEGITTTANQPAAVSENGTQQVQDGPVSINIQGFAFSPKTITVKVGTQVTWTNLDNVGHTATALDGTYDSGLLNNGESFTFQFDQSGTFEYHCTPHPSMRGIIIVVP
jgi:plastocyanin